MIAVPYIIVLWWPSAVGAHSLHYTRYPAMSNGTKKWYFSFSAVTLVSAGALTQCAVIGCSCFYH